ncbi:hypothetical protein [Paenibacillus luteus]|uniref:hypothetical protein n=1 Tax=Paenibacillus luteus TaxID=2545753 RepID=UPI0011427996|nr:hypothetical protein [Paenibacillus luteus]
MSASETAHLLSELLEVSPEERNEVSTLLQQHGTVVFWARLEEWPLSNDLRQHLKVVKQLLHSIAPERREADAPGFVR